MDKIKMLLQELFMMLYEKKKQNTEFSKKIVFYITLGYALVLVCTFILMYKTGDLSPLSYIIPATAGELATATAFYFNKAKAENQLKISQNIQEEKCQ